MVALVLGEAAYAPGMVQWARHGGYSQSVHPATNTAHRTANAIRNTARAPWANVSRFLFRRETLPRDDPQPAPLEVLPGEGSVKETQGEAGKVREVPDPTRARK